MSEKQSFLQFLKNWMLPLAMAFGAVFYFFYHFLPVLDPIEPAIDKGIKEVQPILVGIMLFLQFNIISPHDLRPRKWHIWILLFQAISFFIFAFWAASMQEAPTKVLVETAMLCIVCPTAAASGVITRKLGGDLPGDMACVVLTNCLAAILLPIMLPKVNPAISLSFWNAFLRILVRVFSILLLPCICAWVIRFFFKKLHDRLASVADWAFYVWGISLALAISLATKSLMESRLPMWIIAGIGAISLLTCIFQFWLGRKIGRPGGRAMEITAGQSLGQKNNGFLIWVCFNFLTPVTSVAGGLYAIWQNLINSMELYEHRHGKA